MSFLYAVAFVIGGIFVGVVLMSAFVVSSEEDRRADELVPELLRLGADYELD